MVDQKFIFETTPGEPSLWVNFAANGNIRAWCKDRNRAELFRLEGLDMQAFYTAETEPDFAASIAEIINEESIDGAACGWRPCSGCYETEDGRPVGKYPHSKMFACDVGAGCRECGGLGATWVHYSAEAIDPIGSFIRNACDVTGDDRDQEKPADLYFSYDRFCVATGTVKVKDTTFYRRLPDAARRTWPAPGGATMQQFHKVKTNGTLIYRGIRIRDELATTLLALSARAEAAEAGSDEAIMQERESCAFAVECHSGFGDPATIEACAQIIRDRSDPSLRSDSVHLTPERYADLLAAEARVNELEAALEPFAKLADELFRIEDGREMNASKRDDAGVWGFDRVTITYGDFRAARSLSPIKEAGNV